MRGEARTAPQAAIAMAGVPGRSLPAPPTFTSWTRAPNPPYNSHPSMPACPRSLVGRAPLYPLLTVGRVAARHRQRRLQRRFCKQGAAEEDLLPRAAVNLACATAVRGRIGAVCVCTEPWRTIHAQQTGLGAATDGAGTDGQLQATLQKQTLHAMLMFVCRKGGSK